MNKYESTADTGILSDNEVVARILGGDKNQYAVIIRRYNQRLYRIGMSIVNDDAEVEDIMQVAYISAYEHLNSFSHRSSFSTWLTRILINESLQRVKKRKRYLNINAANMDNERLRHHATAQTPASTLINAELKTVLENSIRQLPEKYRTVFIMREIEGMNTAETKACLDISEVNVKVRLNRAKVLLKNSISALYNKEDIIHFHLDRCDRMVDTVISLI